MEMQKAKHEGPEGSLQEESVTLELKNVWTYISPLSIELILDHVLDHCDIETVRACTLVWKKEASSALRRNFWLTFYNPDLINPDFALQTGLNEMKMNQLLSNTSNAEFRYKKLKLFEDQWGQAKFQDFLRAYGAQLNSLCIITSHKSLFRTKLNEYPSGISGGIKTLPKFIHAALSVWCPNLVELRIEISSIIYKLLNRTLPTGYGNDDLQFVTPLKLKVIQMEIRLDAAYMTSQEALNNNDIVGPLVNLIVSAVAASPNLKTIDCEGIILVENLVTKEKTDLGQLRNLWMNFPFHFDRQIVEKLHLMSMPNLRSLKLNGDALSYNIISDILPTFLSTLLTEVEIEMYVPKHSTLFQGEAGGLALVSRIVNLLPTVKILTLKVTGVKRLPFAPGGDYCMWDNVPKVPHENLRSLRLIDEYGGMLLIDDVQFFENIAFSFKNLQHLEVDVFARRKVLRGRSRRGQLASKIPLEMALKYLASMTRLDQAILRFKFRKSTPPDKNIVVFGCSMLQRFRQDVELKQAVHKMTRSQATAAVLQEENYLFEFCNL